MSGRKSIIISYAAVIKVAVLTSEIVGQDYPNSQQLDFIINLMIYERNVVRPVPPTVSSFPGNETSLAGLYYACRSSTPWVSN